MNKEFVKINKEIAHHLTMANFYSMLLRYNYKMRQKEQLLSDDKMIVVSLMSGTFEIITDDEQSILFVRGTDGRIKVVLKRDHKEIDDFMQNVNDLFYTSIIQLF